MAQSFLDHLTVEMRDDMKALIRKEIDQVQEAKTFAELNETLWQVHELRSVIHLEKGCEPKRVFNLIPDLNAGNEVN